MPSFFRKTPLALAVVLTAAAIARAIQTQVMIQGFLTNPSGTPYTTAQATEFRVYQGGNATTAGSGTLYYDETATVTPSASGVFNYPLGSGAPTVPFLVVGGATIPNILSTTTFDTSSAVYLEISVGGTVVLPRLQMLGTPYAALAGTSESLKPTTQPLITTSNLQASSGTFTASGANQASLATSSSIIVNAGGVTAPYFNGTLNGNVNGTVTGGAGSVAAGSVTPGTFGPGVLVLPANVVGGLASTNTVNTFPLPQSFPGGVVGSSANFANGITAASGTFTASGPTQYSLATASGIVVAAGGVTAPYFNGMLIGSVSGGAGSVAAGSVTPGTFGAGVLVPPQNVIGGLASTNTVNVFPLVQSFPGGVLGSSANFTNGVTAASATFTASGPNQASLATSSSIIVNAGGVTAPYFNGTLNGNVTGGAGSVAAGSVTPGIFGGGVLLPPGNVIGGLASTNTVNTFPLPQSFPGGVVGSSANFTNGVTAASGTFTASGPTQYSLATASGIVVAAGGVTAPYFNGLLIGNVSGGAGSIAAANVQNGTLNAGVLLNAGSLTNGPVASSILPSSVAYTSISNTFPLPQSFPGGVVGSSASFTNAITAASGTFTASGPNQASLATSSSIIVNAGGVTAPYFNGMLIGNVSGGAGNVAAGNVTPGTFGPGVLVPPQNVIGGLASTNTANTFPLVQAFPGGVVGSSASFTNGVTAASGTFTASGPGQASILTSSGIVVSAGGVTAPYVAAANLYGNGTGISGVVASNIAATNVQNGTLNPGVLLNAGSLTNGPVASAILPSTVAYTSLDNNFSSNQTVAPAGDAQTRIGGIYSGPTSGYSGNGQETSRHQLVFRSWSNVVNDTLGAKLVAINKTAYGGAPWYLSQTAELHLFLLRSGALSGDDTVDLFQWTPNGVFTASGGVAAGSGNFTNGVTAATGTFTASGSNQASVTTSSGIIVNAGGVTAPYIAATNLYGNGAGITGVTASEIAATNVQNGTLNAGVLLNAGSLTNGPVASSILPSTVAYTSVTNTFPLVQAFPGGVVGSSGSFSNGVTASSGTFTATGNNQASITTSSGIIVNAGGLTAPYVSATNLYGNGSGITNVSAASVNGANVTGTVQVANGGTGASSAAGAQTALGVPSTTGSGASGTWGINVTGNAATVTTNANLTGNVTSVGNATTIASLPAISGASLTSLTGGNVSGNIPGNAANVTGTVAVANGGTGATTAAGAQTNLSVPSTTGSGASGTWGINITGNAATVTTDANLTGNVTSVGNATTIASLPAISGANLTSLTGGNVSGNIPGNAANVTGTVAVANGGTGATTAAGAQTNLGVPSTTGSGASGTWAINITGSAGSAGGAAPIGAITAYAGTTEPSGWIECNGRAVAQTGTASASWGSYSVAALFAAIGTVWGSSGAGQFNIPDFRGIFPRGWNHTKTGSYSDPDASSRVAQYASGATGDAIGSYETDQLRSHTHTTTGFNGYTSGGSAFTGYLSVGSLGNTSGASGGNETRPTNASVMYIIRVQ